MNAAARAIIATQTQRIADEYGNGLALLLR